MGPTILLRQDLDFEKAVNTAFYEFNHGLNFLEITEMGNLPKHPLLFCSSHPFFAFISLPISPNCAQQLYSKPLLLHNQQQLSDGCVSFFTFSCHSFRLDNIKTRTTATHFTAINNPNTYIQIVLHSNSTAEISNGLVCFHWSGRIVCLS